MNRLVIIDGNAILHRAYHALPPLTAPDGSLVNAVYGFTSMLFKIYSDFKPNYLAVAFDRPAPTFRKEIFKEYQAKRPKMDEELVGQIGKVHDVVRALGISIFELDGYEADDILATIASQCQIDQVIIVTGDRDILQLVHDEKVFVYMPTKGLSEGKLYGEKEVVERMGVKPEQIPDFKALAGDASDNYPGVAGIGPKGAATLITEFGSIENLYQAIKKKTIAASKLSPAVLEKLASGVGEAVMAKGLATIRCDLPIRVDLNEARVETLDSAAARTKLKELNFQSLLKRLEGKQETNAKRKNKDSQTTKSALASQQQQLF